MKVIVLVVAVLVVFVLMFVLEILREQKNVEAKTKRGNTTENWALKVFTDLVVGIILLLIEYYVIA